MKIFKNNSNNNFEHQKKFPRTKKTDFLYKILLASKANEQGSGLVFAFAVGFLLLILGTATIVTSGQNKTNAVVNEFSQKSLAITQAGVNNLMAQLSESENSSLLVLNNDPIDPNDPSKRYLDCADDPDTADKNECEEWTDTTVTLSYTGEANSCASSASVTISSIKGVNSSQGVGSGNGAGEFQLLAYRFEDGDGDLNTTADNIGRLLVQGNLTSSTDSKSRFEVEIPVTIGQASSGEGSSSIMAEQMEIGSPDLVTGTVTCTEPANCPLDCEGGTEATPEQLESAIGVGNQGLVNDDITVGGSVVPDLQSVSDGVYVNPLTPCELGDVPSCNDTLVLPRDSDTASGGIYYYQEKNEATLKTNIGIKSDDEIRIYLSGNVNYGGSNFITRSDADGNLDTTSIPTNGQIRIYGGTISVDDSNNAIAATPDVPNVTAAGVKDWEMSGNACIHGLIHAPNAYISYKGAGNANACDGFADPYDSTNFYGVVWVKGFGVESDGTISNNANTLEFNVDSGLLTTITSEYGEEAFYPDVIKMGSATKIERREAN